MLFLYRTAEVVNDIKSWNEQKITEKTGWVPEGRWCQLISQHWVSNKTHRPRAKTAWGSVMFLSLSSCVIWNFSCLSFACEHIEPVSWDIINLKKWLCKSFCWPVVGQHDSHVWVEEHVSLVVSAQQCPAGPTHSPLGSRRPGPSLSPT